ncbi:MAG: radical SAM protein [Candidatus Wallbacteria bacterium]|nr:radical SAM protein [Candidatus Wallbacteria bacterium]
MSHAYSLDPVLYTSASDAVDRRYMGQMREQDQAPVATDASKPRFTLVVGPSPFTMPRGWEFFLASPYEGISYIATVLHNAGYPVRIVDVRYDRNPVQSALEQILPGTDVLGVATFEDNFPFQEELIALVKQRRPDLPVILGGSLVTSVPHVLMRHTRADVAVISEGEITILELLDSYAAGDWPRKLPEIRGIWYRTPSGEIARTTPRGQVLDLNSLPRMNLSLWPQSRGPGGLQPQIIASHSRGCKMDCSFCYRTTPQLREKSPEKLRQELRHLKDSYQIEFVFFVDLTFTSDKRRTLEICSVIEEFDIGWTCLTRCADVDPEVLGAMQRSGCDIILYGVESLSAKVLREARKGSHENTVLRAMNQTFDAGLRFGGLTIVGLPGETEESLDHMCSWAEEYRHITRVKYLSAMPGTTVYHEALRDGMIRSEVDHLRWLATEQALERDEFLNYNGLPPTVIRRAYKRLYDSYQPGPVMDFRHFPAEFEYFDPDPDPSRPWRGKFSSASAPLMPGIENHRRPELCHPGTRFTPHPIEAQPPLPPAHV